MRSEYFVSNCYLPEIVNGQAFFENTYCNFSFPRHFHDEYLVQIVNKGQNTFYCNGAVHTATAGDVVLINPGEIHNGSCFNDEPLQYSVFYIRPEVLGDINPALAGDKFFLQTLVNDPALYNHIVHFLELVKTRSADHFLLNERYFGLLQSISEKYISTRVAPHECDDSHSPRLAMVKEYIQDNLCNKLSLEALSKLSSISPFHFLRIFTRYTGITLHQFIMVKRLEASKSMLKSSNTISDVSFSLGFADQSHFTRCFKRMTGITPRQFQELHRKTAVMVC